MYLWWRQLYITYKHSSKENFFLAPASHLNMTSSHSINSKGIHGHGSVDTVKSGNLYFAWLSYVSSSLLGAAWPGSAAGLLSLISVAASSPKWEATSLILDLLIVFFCLQICNNFFEELFFCWSYNDGVPHFLDDVIVLICQLLLVIINKLSSIFYYPIKVHDPGRWWNPLSWPIALASSSFMCTSSASAKKSFSIPSISPITVS